MPAKKKTVTTPRPKVVEVGFPIQKQPRIVGFIALGFSAEDVEAHRFSKGEENNAVGIRDAYSGSGVSAEDAVAELRANVEHLDSASVRVFELK